MTFQNRLNKKNIEDIILYSAIVISAILLALIVNEVLKSVFYRKVVLNIVSAPAVETSQTKSLQQYIESITPIFRSETISSDVSEVTQTVAPSDMKLKATFIGDTVSLAIISVSGKDKTFLTGDVEGNFNIEEILPDRVILTKSGSPESVILRMDYGFAADVPVIHSQSGNTDGQVSDSLSQQKEVSKREFIALLDPPDRIAREVALAPVGRDGNPYGIQMTFVKPGSLIQQMGFVPGDILLSMNNKQLLTPEDGMMAYQTMKNEDSVTFKVERGGSVIGLNINFK